CALHRPVCLLPAHSSATELSTLSLHDALPIYRGPSSLDHAILERRPRWGVTALSAVEEMDAGPIWATAGFDLPPAITKSALYNRSEEHTSELQSRENLVCRLLLEKKNNK